MGGFILLVHEITLVCVSHMKSFRELKWLCINMLSEIITYHNVYMSSCSYKIGAVTLSLCSEQILEPLDDFKSV